jgi:hypothetical protein
LRSRRSRAYAATTDTPQAHGLHDHLIEEPGVTGDGARGQQQEQGLLHHSTEDGTGRLQKIEQQE